MDATKIRDALKALLGVKDETRDAELDRYVSVAVSAVELYTNRRMASDEVTDRFYTPSRDGVVLNTSPVAAVLRVRADGVQLADTEWRLERGGVIRRVRANGFAPVAWGAGLVEADYQVGLLTAPAWLIEATAAVAAEFEAKIGGGSVESIKRESIPGVFSVEYDSGSGSGAFGIPSEVAVLLDMIREPGIA